MRTWRIGSIRETARAARSGARSEDERRRWVGEAVGGLDFIAEVIPGPPPDNRADSFAVLFRNSYHSGRMVGPLAGYDLQLRQTEGTLMSYRSGRGTGHGSPYLYDRHVPLIFLGAGVRAGSSDQPVATVDLAPTLARLARVPVPPDLDGRPILP